MASNETGTLTLRSEPWCDVYLDGEKIGVTPLAKHALAAGPHKVSLRNEAMAARRDLVVNVKPNEDVVQAIVFPMGKLAIRVQPWAKVSLNGKPVGTTPMEPLDIAAGRHEVRLENAQLSKDEKHPVVIKEGKQEIIKVIWE